MDKETLQAALASAGLVGLAPTVNAVMEPPSYGSTFLPDKAENVTVEKKDTMVIEDNASHQSSAPLPVQKFEENVISCETAKETPKLSITVKYMYYNIAQNNCAEDFVEPDLIDLGLSAIITVDDAKMSTEKFKAVAEREFVQLCARQTGEENQILKQIDLQNDIFQTTIQNIEGYDIPGDVHVKTLGSSTLLYVVGVLRNPEPLLKKKKMSKQAPAKNEYEKYKEMHDNLYRQSESSIVKASLALKSSSAIKIAESVYDEYFKSRKDGEKTVEQTLEIMGAQVQIKGMRTVEQVKNLINDKLVRSMAVINSRLNMTREIDCLEQGVEEHLNLQHCNSMPEVLEYYASRRHLYDPHDVFGKLVETFMPGTQITIASQNLKERYAMQIRHIETAIFICVLVEYGVVESFDVLEQFLL